MPDAQPLILDDVGAALAAMTDLGRAVVERPAQEIREAVRAFAQRRGWHVVPHEAYVAWSSAAFRATQGTWIILDPLYPRADYGAQVEFFHLTRAADPRSSSREALPDLGRVAEESVGLIDDAAASGFTMRLVAKSIQAAGARVSAIQLCASTRGARNTIRAMLPHAKLSTFQQGDSAVGHLRDGCPFLPFTGRRTTWPPVEMSDTVHLERRIPSTAITGSLWSVLMLDNGVRAAVNAAWSLVVDELSRALGRPASVADVSLLGKHMALQTSADIPLTASSLLRELQA